MIKPLLAVAFLTLLIGCASGAPPTRAETALYHVQTNFFTNVNQYAQVDTNKIDGHTMLITNTFWVTNIYPTFTLEPKKELTDGIAAAGSIATTSGVPWGGLASTLLTGLLWMWAEFRNRNKEKLGVVLAQNIETAREIFKAQTEGAKLDSAFKAEIQSQQVKAGVKAAAAAMSDTMVDSKEAKSGAASVFSMAKTARVAVNNVPNE